MSKNTHMDVVEIINQRLRELMLKHNVRAAPLAKAAELNESAVRDILRGRSKNPGIITLKKIAGVLGLRPAALFEAGAKWPVIGASTSGGLVEKITDASPTDFWIESPFLSLLSPNLAAIYAQDSSLAPLAYEGSYLIFDRTVEGISDEGLGKPCVCELDNGERRIRMLRLGASQDEYHLMPINPYTEPEMQRRVKRAAPVLFALPAELFNPTKKPTHPPHLTLQEGETPFKR